MIRELQYGSKSIQYYLEFCKRKTLGITVTPEGDVLVKVPLDTNQERINEKLGKRAGWVLKQQSYFLNFYPKTPARKFNGGETHLYLGRQYLLRTKLAKKNEVHFNGRYLDVYHTPKRTVKTVLNSWYRHKAKEKFAEIAEPWIVRFEQYKVQPKELFIQEMPTRWGSCTANGKIILNPELIKAPKPCIEYVIIHELCHLVHRHHTEKFFILQSTLMPDWEKWKNKLEMVLL